MKKNIPNGTYNGEILDLRGLMAGNEGKSRHVIFKYKVGIEQVEDCKLISEKVIESFGSKGGRTFKEGLLIDVVISDGEIEILNGKNGEVFYDSS